MRIVFMGSPDIASFALKRLIESGYDICAVVSQPDKKTGRGQKLSPSPVKQVAMENNLKIFTPQKLRQEKLHEQLAELKPDIAVVFAYGKILPTEVLAVPKFGCINIHLSLLPKYRGAAPIQHAILNGDKITGATIMKLDEGMDTGDIITSSEVDILEDDNAELLTETLTVVGIDLLLGVLKQIEKTEKIVSKPQDNSQASYARLIKKEDGEINWDDSSEVISNQIKALVSWPTAYSYINDKAFKIHKAEIYMTDEEMGVDEEDKPLPGTVYKLIKKHGIVVKTGDGYIIIIEGQPESKNVMSGTDLINGGFITESQIFKSKNK